MKFLSALVLSLTLSVMVLSTNAFAGNTDPLFVNLTTNDTWRSYMALTFSRHQLDKGHPVTIFLNDHGVFLASKKDSRRYFREQKLIHDIVAKGGVVLSCGMCMHKFVIKDSQIIPDVKVSRHGEAGKALFADHTKTLTW
ncbi:MAG: DsrE family protein [Nitrospiraceae bacterium]|nr:DsrE family protein [Nitrospiraceae bacterium]